MAKIFACVFLLLPSVLASEALLRINPSQNSSSPESKNLVPQDEVSADTAPDGVLSAIGETIYSVFTKFPAIPGFSSIINVFTPASVPSEESSPSKSMGTSSLTSIPPSPSLSPLTGCKTPDGRPCRNTKRLQRQLNRDRIMSQKRPGTATPGTPFEQDVLKCHNKLRRHFNLKPLSWDFTLRTGVANYLSYLRTGGCEMVHSSQERRSEVGMFFHVGENLYIKWGPTTDAPPSGWHVSKAWFNEVSCYSYGPQGDPCTKSRGVEPFCLKSNHFTPSTVKVGHFTQLMWQHATHLGCAMTSCQMRGNRRNLVGCWYGSTVDDYGGNVKGSFPFAPEVAAKMKLPSCPAVVVR